MNPINVYTEAGEKKVFAGALDWPGWCRGGRDELSARQALLAYGPRYAGVLQGSGIEFHAPADLADFVVVERRPGDVSTDFGAPGAIPAADREPLDLPELERLQSVLLACWRAFDQAEQRARGRELRKGPRGGGRDLEKMIEHMLEADLAYLNRLAWKRKRETGADPLEELRRTRQAVVDALAAAVNAGLPERGPRGGLLWPVRYFIRRVAWHVLDHALEIEDRIL